MSIIPPNRRFEGSDLGPINHLKELIAKVNWPSLKPMDRKNTAQRLLGFSARNGVPLEIAVSLLSTAVATAGATYKASFYTHNFSVSLARANEENQKDQ